MGEKTSSEWLRLLADLSAESRVQPDPEKLRGIADEIERLKLENLNRLSELNNANKRIRSLMGVQ